MIKLLFFLLMVSVFAAENFSGKDSMNDIRYADYKDFPEKWALVTIRFRKDTGEMRLTYANELAMKTMSEGSINYPDGAVFAKTGIHTGVDPQFVSSVVPQGIRRYQLMVKNKAKYASTGGWGYGLFDPEGKTFPEDPKTTQDACYACHTMVENRGDVFSQPFSFTKNTQFPKPLGAMAGTKIQYVWKNRLQLPQQVASFIPKSFKKVRYLTNKILRMNLFQGTLDELKPLLEQEAKTAKSPAVFISNDDKRFVIVMMTQSDKCMGEGAVEIISTDIQNRPLVEKICTHD
jgi:hypothetical protein